jgi:hypothetical protein
LESGLAFDAHSAVLQNLRTELAQPEQEPVAWMYTRLKDGSSIKLVEKRAEMPEGGWSLYKEEPLYTTPPQRKPLTEEMRKQMLEVSDNYERRGAFVNGWLSAEAAHNIKEQP